MNLRPVRQDNDGVGMVVATTTRRIMFVHGKALPKGTIVEIHDRRNGYAVIHWCEDPERYPNTTSVCVVDQDDVRAVVAP